MAKKFKTGSLQELLHTDDFIFIAVFVIELEKKFQVLEVNSKIREPQSKCSKHQSSSKNFYSQKNSPIRKILERTSYSVLSMSYGHT